MKKQTGHILFFIVTFIFIFSQFGPRVAAEENEKKHVFILNSYNEGSEWTDNIVKGIKSSLKYKNENLFIDTEYMDTKKRCDEEYLEKSYEFYKYKYSNTKYDVIICSDNEALNFLLKYGERLFPKTPVVFCGINSFKEDMIKGHELYTGIVENTDYKDTINSALLLNPNLKKIFVISDETNFGMEGTKQVKNLVSQYKNIEFDFYDWTDESSVKSHLSALKPDSIVLLMCTTWDNYGRYVPMKEFARIVAQNSTVPVYTMWDFNLNSGVLGGKITSGRDQGESAGKLADQILKGKKVSNLPVIKNNYNKYIFDYQIMKRYGLKTEYLPKNSIIVNEPETKYNIPKTYILIALLVLITVSFIVNYIFMINISKRKKSEMMLRESEEQYRKLFELSPDAIIVNKNGFIKLANNASLKLLGVESYEELIDRPLSDFVPVDLKDNSRISNTESKEENGSIHLKEGKIMRKDGSIIDVEISTTLFPYKGESVVLTVERDITDSKRLLETLEYDKIKTEFFSNISHELRTPLNVILSALQLWELYEKEGLNSPGAKNKYKYIDIMKQNCYRLLRLIGNLIDITKIDSNYIQPHFENRNIINIVEDITLSVAEYIEDKEISLIFDTEVEERFILCDTDKIERIILNLLSNAVKFTNPGGSIFVNIYDRKDKIIISVKDTGIGIPEDKLEMIFERFKQVDKSLSRNKEGSGIGLSLVKAFTEMHGGEVFVNSKYGSGSEFIVELPINRLPEDECAATYDKENGENYVRRVSVEFSDIYKE